MPCTISFMGMKVQDSQRVEKQHMLSRVDDSLSSVEGTKWGQMQILCFQVISYFWNSHFSKLLLSLIKLKILLVIYYLSGTRL